MPHKTDGMPYEIHPSPQTGKDGRKLLYVRPQSKRKVTMEQIDAYCAKHYALRPGELTLAFRAFIEATGYYLSEGYRIETLIGSFAPKIGLTREVTDPSEVKNSHVRFEGIEYRSAKDFEQSVAHWLQGFRRAGNPDVQRLMADSNHLEQALRENLDLNHGYVTARSFARQASLTYYSARKQLDSWCQGLTPRLQKTRQGQEYIYTEV